MHKIFNGNTIKVSYSCMSNVKSIITNHNTGIIRKSQPQDISAENCNCRNKHACPLQNKCMSKDIVYKATINTGSTQDTKHYIGMTSNTFKERYRNLIKSFTHKKYSNETELSKHVWHLKQNKTDFDCRDARLENEFKRCVYLGAYVEYFAIKGVKMCGFKTFWMRCFVRRTFSCCLDISEYVLKCVVC